ncbi:SLC13 family permease [Dolosicoccus paucivorans]
MLAIVSFTLFAILMYVLITNKLIPPVAFVILPSIAALAIGTSLTDLATYIGDGLGSILNTAVMFLFSISYFTMMADQGLFDPLVNFITKKFGKNVTMIFIAVLLVALVSHLDGSGASTYLITIPAFKLIMDRLGVKPTAFLGTVIAMMSTMNILPWGDLPFERPL